jgi:uncharacterized protein YndB with AHSA1/START domain
MATNRRMIEAPPEAVWDVLADASSYGDWVVGAYDIRGVEGGWPAPGARFHHTQGRPPLKVEDTTLALSADAPRRLAMEVRVRPFLVGRVEFALEAVGTGTRVTMVERPIGGVLSPVFNPVIDLLTRARNAETLRRLERLAVERVAARARRGARPPAARSAATSAP